MVFYFSFYVGFLSYVGFLREWTNSLKYKRQLPCRFVSFNSADGACRHTAASLFDLEATIGRNERETCTSVSCLRWNGKESQKMLLHRKLLNFKSQSIEKYLRIVQNFWQEKSSTLRCSSSLPWWSGCQILCQKRNVLELARLEQCNLNIYTQKAIFGSTRKIWRRSAGALYHKKKTNKPRPLHISFNFWLKS